MNSQMKLNLEDEVREFVGDFNKFFEELKEWTKDATQIKTWERIFLKKYPKMFGNSSETKMDIDEGKTRPKKPNLAEIKEKLLCKRTTEAFTDYCGVESDPNLTLVEKIIKLQEGIGNATRRKIHYASLQRQLLEDCFRESKEPYKRTLEQVNIKKRWALFLRKLHKLVLEFNQLAFCTVSLRFIHYNFKVIEELCKSDPDNWTTGNNFGISLRKQSYMLNVSIRAHRFHHQRITFIVFLSGESEEC